MALHKPARHGIAECSLDHCPGDTGYFFGCEVISIGARGEPGFDRRIAAAWAI